MASRSVLRLVRLPVHPSRLISTTSRLSNKDRTHSNVDGHRKAQIENPLNPHMTNTNSTISNEMPSLGKDKPPPEFISSVDSKFTPQDSVPENTERMTGGTQKGSPESGVNKELDVGEMEDVSFKVEPLERTGEDANTMRARLLCLSHNPVVWLFDHVLIQFCVQIRAERGELSKVICYCLPLLTPILPK